MFNAQEKILAVLALGTVFVLAMLAGVSAGLPQSATKKPQVVGVTQITHDGVRKTNLLSDGASLYVSESPSSQRLIAKISLQTTDRSVLPTTFSNPQALDISPDHRTILISSDANKSAINEFWTLPLDGGAPARLGELTGRDAVWSADGKFLAFAKEFSLYVTSLEGSSPREVFTADGSVFTPRISPDGKRIRFTVGNVADGTTAIWEVNVDGSGAHALLGSWSNASAACCGSWTRDGRYYIFQVTQGTLTTLWALPDAASSMGPPVQLTSGPTSFGNVFLSADGEKFWAIGVQPTAEVVTYKAHTVRMGRLAPLLAGVSATDLDFSPDGKWITYVSIPQRELWRCRANGSDKLQLTSAPETAALPRWSPDGSKIAYARLIPGQPTKIAIVSAAGGPAEDLLDENASQIDANWSADGSNIMIGSFAQDKDINIRLVDLKNHHVQIIPGSEGIFSPRWSPNRRYIAALSPDFTKVLLFDFETQRWTTWLSEAAGAVSYPIWSADSKYLYFDDFVTGIDSIRRAKLGESSTSIVFTVPNFDRYPGPFGLWSGRTPDGSWIFVRDRSTQEVYQLDVNFP